MCAETHHILSACLLMGIRSLYILAIVIEGTLGCMYLSELVFWIFPQGVELLDHTVISFQVFKNTSFHEHQLL